MRILLNKQTGQLTAYPRNDDQPVVGLDRTVFAVLEQVLPAAPEPGPGQAVRPLGPVVAIKDPAAEDLNGTATYGWEVYDLPPAPNWDAFEQLVQQQSLIGQAMAAARENQDAAMDAAGVPQGEPSASALPVALVDARAGDLRRLRACWPAVAVRGGVTEEQATALAIAAESLNMPAELVELLAGSYQR